ncbi:MAG: hypothetical protein M3312_09075 [Actinomycetota bacterium]|nr:hypothetical protein [Actinomycetota bacterium]
MLVLGGLLALAAAVLGLVIGLGDDWNSNGERALWLVLTVGGAALLAAGLWSAAHAPSAVAAALIVIGALMCGVATFWSIVMPLVAIAVAVMAIVWVRRPRAASG